MQKNYLGVLRRRNFKNLDTINLSELMIQPYFAPETTLII